MLVRGPKSGFRSTVAFRRELRKNLTPVEQRFWYYVGSKRFKGLKFRKQHAIGKYIVDFYCAEYNLIVEIDGDSHATDLGKQNDDVRTKYLESLGYKIVRYNNLDVIHNIDGVFQDLAKYVSSLGPPGSGPGQALAPPREEGEQKKD